MAPLAGDDASARNEDKCESSERTLSTAEANTFLGRKKGFLEKRRSAGVDSPVYIQSVKNGHVRYRRIDLVRWEDERRRSSSSEFA